MKEILSPAEIYSCFDKGCPTEKHVSVRDNTERHDGLWLFTVASSKFTSFQRDGRRCYEYLFACVKRNEMDSELLTCLLKFIEYFPDYLSALSRTLLRFLGQPLSKQLYTECRYLRQTLKVHSPTEPAGFIKDGAS